MTRPGRLEDDTGFPVSHTSSPATKTFSMPIGSAVGIAERRPIDHG